ncbi:MAG TPA: lysylphosphatidylglycerol synthase transmembrane domain-containing protein [Candidatus Kapabacteria bacterium]|nr:lysylphosphatidylglycerol synthase transmembrane domain-containing protein [Candidatus Kapabacteria bacterium]
MLKHPAFRYALAILIGGGALYLAFHRQHLHRLAEDLEGANLFVIVAGTLVMFLSHLVRAWRYKMFLRPIAPHTRLSSAFRALIAGYATNNFLPRGGDIVRPVLFSKRENIPISSSVAVMLIERLADFIGLTALLGITIFAFRAKLSVEFPAIELFWLPIAALLGLLCIFAVLILFSEKKTRRVIEFLARALPKRFRGAIERGAARTEEGLRGVRTGSAVPAIVGTFGISALYTASMFVSTLAFRGTGLMHVGIVGCFLLQSMSGIAFILPSPGGTGTYHFLISQALAVMFGVPPALAIAFATLTHASNYLLTTVVGILFMMADGISLTSVRKVKVPVAAQTNDAPEIIRTTAR